MQPVSGFFVSHASGSLNNILDAQRGTGGERGLETPLREGDKGGVGEEIAVSLSRWVPDHRCSRAVASADANVLAVKESQ